VVFLLFIFWWKPAALIMAISIFSNGFYPACCCRLFLLTNFCSSDWFRCSSTSGEQFRMSVIGLWFFSVTARASLIFSRFNFVFCLWVFLGSLAGDSKVHQVLDSLASSLVLGCCMIFIWLRSNLWSDFIFSLIRWFCWSISCWCSETDLSCWRSAEGISWVCANYNWVSVDCLSVLCIFITDFYCC
jgi:hypothetical protein